MNLLAILALLAIFGVAGYMIFDSIRESLRRRTGVGARPRIYCDRFRRVSHGKFKRSLSAPGMIFAGSLCLLALCAFVSGHGGIGVIGLTAAPAAALSQEQIDEFKSVIEGLKSYGEMFPALKELWKADGGGFAALKKLPENIKELGEGYKKLTEENSRLKKMMLSHNTGTGVRWVGAVPFVSEDCARALTSIYILRCAQQGQWPAAFREAEAQQRAVAMACDALGIEQRTALTSTEIPVPTIYVPQIIELVWKFGQIRQFGTVFPLGAGSVKLPRLAAGEDTFGYLGVGTAGMSQIVQEKRVTAELITFTANKFGGIIRIPTELEEDTFIPMGQFLGRYIGRQFAKMEDNTSFNGDGTATYANISGISKYCTTNAAYLQQLGAGKTKPSDSTLSDWRNMRGRVNGAALFNAAYYCHPTMDALLVTFNTLGQPLVYQRMPGGGATLDGFPVRWTGVHAVYGTAASASAHLATFGDLSYAYLGERGAPRVETSRDVYFATDELAMRALERIDFELMAVDAVSALLTAAA